MQRLHFVFSSKQMSLRKWKPVIVRVNAALSRDLDFCPYVTLAKNPAPVPASVLPEFIAANGRIAILLHFLFVVLEQQCHGGDLPLTLSEVRLSNFGFARVYLRACMPVHVHVCVEGYMFRYLFRLDAQSRVAFMCCFMIEFLCFAGADRVVECP